MAVKRKARVLQEKCVSCGSCLEVCPRGAISIFHGCYAQVELPLRHKPLAIHNLTG